MAESPTISIIPQTDIDPYDNIILCTGKKRSGKSTLAKKLASSFKRVIVWDPNGEHKGKELLNKWVAWMEKPETPIIVHNLGDLRIAWTGYRVTDPRYIIYRPISGSKDEFNSFCYFINHYVVYCCIYIEELPNVVTANSIPSEFQILEASGRHRKCGLLLTSRSNNRIPTRIFDDADYIFMFKQKRPESYDYIAEYVSAENVEKLKASPDYYFVMVAPDSNDYFMKPIIPT